MDVQTKQQRIAELAKRHGFENINPLNHYVDEEWMREAYRRTRKSGAVGIDHVTSKEYEEKLTENLRSLLDRFKAGDYHAPAVKRVYIPKGNTSKELRPIGIPTFEDKILQRALCMILEPIFEQEFIECSYGFRPKRTAHQALEKIWHTAMDYHGGCWIIEIDIRKYFDNVNHEHLRSFYKQRIGDGVVRRVLGKWLKAGVMEDGLLSYPDVGTPQGGVVSPLLSNVYLHEVLDVWFENMIKPCLKGRTELIRYADDAVLMFEKKDDAERVMRVLPKRFERFGLQLHPEKTRLVEFCTGSNNQHGEERKQRTFDFLGFTHYWGKSSKGRIIPKRKTAKDRLKRAIRSINVWCKENRHLPVTEQQKELCSKVQGHYGYYGITFNAVSIDRFLQEVKRVWRKWLNRRNRNNQMNWERFVKLYKRYPLPKPRIVHSYISLSESMI